MRLIFWVTAFAVLSISCAKNSTAKTKPKRQLENIRTPQNLQYSLVLPHSRVAHFRSLSSSRRISNVQSRGGKLPPYAVQMEPVVQYSQKDPLYDPNHDHTENTGVNRNEIYAQPKILNVHDQDSEGSFGPPYGALPTAPLYSEDVHPHYIDAPEPIIEIIIKESNESLPAPPPAPIQKKKKEPVQVFYVKYSKDPHSKDKVVYEKPIPAITPPSNDEDDHHEEYVTVTPEPLYIPAQTTTLRAIIKPESEIYHSNSNVKITFGNNNHHYDNRREENSQHEDREETAPRPAIALPNQRLSEVPSERSVSPRPQYSDHDTKHINHPSSQTFQFGQQAQNRIQFQQPFISHEPQLPRQGPSLAPFRGQVPRQNPFGPSPSLSPRPSFPSVSPSPSNHFANVAPTIPGPVGPVFPTFARPSNQPPFHPRPSNAPPFGTRQHFPPRTSFHSGPQRPFHQTPQPQPYFDEAKYLQENYHTITTDQVDPPKIQLTPNRPTQHFNQGPKPSANPSQVHFSDHQSRPQQLIPFSQQLPQQRPAQVFDSNKPSFTVSPSRSPFFNLKPSPPHIEDNRTPFQRQPSPTHQHASFHFGSQSISRPLNQQTQENIHNQHSFSGINSPSPSPSPSPLPSGHNQFLPQPSSPPLFNFHSQSSSIGNQPSFQQHGSITERPQNQQNHFQLTSNAEHQHNINQFVPNGGELVAAIPKYEQHITVNGANSDSDYKGLNILSQPTPTPQDAVHQQQQVTQDQSQYLDAEQQQVRLQLAQNVRKQQEEIQRLQNQLQYAQQQHNQQQHQHQQQQQQQQQQNQQQQQQIQQQQQQIQQQQQQQKQQQQEQQQKQHQQQQQQQQQYQQHQQQQQQQQQNTQYDQNYNQYQYQQSISNPQYVQERTRQQPTYVSSTASPAYYQSTARTVEIRPTTQKYVSSTVNTVSSAPETKDENKKRPAIELPDEVPDDLRQQLLSSGILDNADISVLDYDKVGETPLESLPPDQLANFFSAGGGQQIASSEHRPIVVKQNGDIIESRIDENADDDDDQDIAASENIASYVAPAPAQKQGVEMKVVHFDPKTPEGQKIASDYVKEDATQIDPVALNDKKYNRYLPLKVSGNQFPLPDVLKGRKITSVVVLAPVQTEALNGEHPRAERAATDNLRGIKFVAGDSLHNLLRKPTKDNFEKWLNTEKKTASDEQSVILLVTGSEEPSEEREIFMYDVASGTVSKLSGELSNAFVEAAENNSLSKDFEKLAIEGEGTPENFNKEHTDDAVSEGSEHVPLFVDLSGVSVDNDNNGVLISSGYSKTKRGRAIRRH
ncbi:myb-like protein AA [Vanessa cardui]|uniref:myb-like protein AA n=1 Tax=Vanessa cardui TaxID=171605 RepID=UPI001F1453E0|nr:myb-like protein AA [Vanessa cardui]